MRNVISLARKDLKLLLRDKPGFFFTFFFPVVYASFFGLIMGGMGGGSASIAVAVVDEDETDGSRAFVEVLRAGAELRLREVNREEATELVRKGKCTAYIILPVGFGDRYQRPFSRGMPEIEAGIDPSRRAEAGLLQGVLAKAMFQNTIEMFTDPEKARASIRDSIAEVTESEEIDPFWRSTLMAFLPALDQFLNELPKNDEVNGGQSGVAMPDFANFGVNMVEVRRERRGPKSAFDISFPQGAVWAMLTCAASFGISLVTERTRGTLLRLRMMPVGPREILAGKAVACFVTTAAVTVALLLFAGLVFGLRPNSVPLLGLAIFCACICFVGIMMLLSVLGKTEQSAAGIGWAILMVMAMIGGGMIPLAFLPDMMRTISHVSPIKWTIYAMEGAVWRGFSPAEMMLPCGFLVAIGVVCFAIGVRAFSWSEQN